MSNLRVSGNLFENGVQVYSLQNSPSINGQYISSSPRLNFKLESISGLDVTQNTDIKKSDLKGKALTGIFIYVETTTERDNNSLWTLEEWGWTTDSDPILWVHITRSNNTGTMNVIANVQALDLAINY